MSITRLELGRAVAAIPGMVAGDGRVSAGKEFQGRRVLIVVLPDGDEPEDDA